MAETATSTPTAQPGPAPAHGEKRTLDQVIEATQTSTGRAKKKAKPGYNHFGRVMARLVDPFTRPMAIINEGIKVSYDEEPPENEADPETHIYWSYRALIDLAPSIKTAVDALDGSVFDPFMAIDNELKEARSDGRSDDTSKIKAAIGDILQVLDIVKSGDPPFPMVSLKGSRGFVNDVSARLLTPAVWQAHLNPGVIDEIRQMEREVTADDFPAFMYENNRCENPDDLEVGLCRGPLLIHVFRHLWIATSAALNLDGTAKTRKKGNAATYNVTKVTPRSIAYAAIQTRFALSSALTWDDIDGAFDVQAFYWNIVELFTDDKTWARETLAWWNRTIFKGRDGRQNSSAAAQAQPGTPAARSSISKIAQQRAEKERAARASALLNVP